MTGTVSVRKTPGPPPTPPPGYPLRLTGHFDESTSRWLWLVKIILVIPHVVVLAFLWLAAMVVTVIAWFAILFTGRYPRSMFDFCVGVLRWSWRVSFYTTGAFGTDKYPPFRLAPDDTYPADLDVAYPQHLSRGLVLIKWWLLAIPQYVIVGILTGGGGGVHMGLVGVLAIIGAASLLFTGSYPRSIFDLAMGFNRWSFRVAAYALLMTDAYPPFRLDEGPDDPPLR
jgi:hypothetical protein